MDNIKGFQNSLNESLKGVSLFTYDQIQLLLSSVEVEEKEKDVYCIFKKDMVVLDTIMSGCASLPVYLYGGYEETEPFVVCRKAEKALIRIQDGNVEMVPNSFHSECTFYEDDIVVINNQGCYKFFHFQDGKINQFFETHDFEPILGDQRYAKINGLKRMVVSLIPNDLRNAPLKVKKI